MFNDMILDMISQVFNDMISRMENENENRK